MKRFAFCALACALAMPLLAADSNPMFRKMDANQDGRVSAREHARGAGAMFKAMDADRNGRVTAGEMTAAQSKVGNQRADGMDSAGKIRAVDRNGDGVLSASEHAAGSRAMFARMDRDRDGALDEREFAAGHAVLSARSPMGLR
jgi:Ca2+-binding EF-hand superfamily protein